MSSFALACAIALNTQTKFSMPLQVGVRSDTPLVAMQSHGRSYLVYELELLNYDSEPAHLEKIAIQDGKRKTIKTLAGDELRDCLTPVRNPDGDPTSLPPGRAAVVYVWLPFPKNAVPTQLTHTLTFGRDDGGPKTVTGGRLELSGRSGVIVRPPLMGSNWVAGNGPSNTSPHRRARLCLDGHASIGQRFAIDWIQVDETGTTFKGPESKNASYFAYNEKVLACADAKVVSVVDGVTENVPHAPTLAVVMSRRTLAGNHVILDLGRGLYAAYAHLIPGSIEVKAGQRVKSGQLLARLGNSGNSSEPHLHFQIMNAPSFAAAEGLPFGHPSFGAQAARAKAGNELELERVGKRAILRNEMPLQNDWVDFPR